MFRNGSELFSALEVIGSDMQTLLNLLLSSKLIKSGDRYSYKIIVNKIVALAGRALYLIWPSFSFPSLFLSILLSFFFPL